jgi:glycosyltransferase involved in cell wall biosynthesis
MKVLLISLQKRGGGALDVLGFSGGLCENGFVHEVMISAYNEFGDRFGDNEYRKVAKIKTYAGGPVSFLVALFLLRPIRFAIRAAKTRPDIIHIVDFHAWALFLYFARPWCGFRIVYSPQDNPFDPKEKSPLAMNVLEKFFVRHADGIVAYSTFVADGLAGHARGKVAIMPLGIYPRVYGKFEKKFDHAGPLEALFFGRIEPYKGVDTLMDAYRILKSKTSDVRLTIAGRGDLPPELAKVAGELGIVLKNYWLSNEELGSLIGSADVIVAPYKEATQSAVVMMAIAYLTPVITTNVGSLADYVTDGYNGFVVGPGDAPAIAAGIQKFSGDQNLLVTMSHNQKIIRDKFSWRTVSRRAVEVYGSLGPAK